MSDNGQNVCPTFGLNQEPCTLKRPSPMVLHSTHDQAGCRMPPAPPLMNTDPNQQPNRLARDTAITIQNVSQGKPIEHYFELFELLMMIQMTSWQAAGEVEKVASMLPIYTAYLSQWKEYLQDMRNYHHRKLSDVKQRLDSTETRFESAVHAYHHRCQQETHSNMAKVEPEPVPTGFAPQLTPDSAPPQLTLPPRVRLPPDLSEPDQYCPNPCQYNPFESEASASPVATEQEPTEFTQQPQPTPASAPPQLPLSPCVRPPPGFSEPDKYLPNPCQYNPFEYEALTPPLVQKSEHEDFAPSPQLTPNLAPLQPSFPPLVQPPPGILVSNQLIPDSCQYKTPSSGTLAPPVAAEQATAEFTQHPQPTPDSAPPQLPFPPVIRTLPGLSVSDQLILDSLVSKYGPLQAWTGAQPSVGKKLAVSSTSLEPSPTSQAPPDVLAASQPTNFSSPFRPPELSNAFQPLSFFSEPLQSPPDVLAAPPPSSPSAPQQPEFFNNFQLGPICSVVAQTASDHSAPENIQGSNHTFHNKRSDVSLSRRVMSQRNSPTNLCQEPKDLNPMRWQPEGWPSTAQDQTGQPQQLYETLNLNFGENK